MTLPPIGSRVKAIAQPKPGNYQLVLGKVYTVLNYMGSEL